LQYIIEKKSAHNFASQLSDLLNPVNLNALLIDFLKDDNSAIEITKQESSSKERVKWYTDDEAKVVKFLKTRSKKDAEIKEMEKRLEELKKAPPGEALTQISEEIILSKTALARLDLDFAPLLLRRLVIANVPLKFLGVRSGLIGYVMQFANDLFELMQYPRVLRNIVFNVLEKSVDSLAKPLEQGAENLLNESVNEVKNQSVFNFFFSNTLKDKLGNIIVTLFANMEATENQTSYAIRFAQTVASWYRPGGYVFSLIQEQIEKLVKIKFKSDEAIEWSAAKLVVTLNDWILESAKDETGEGMKAGIASQLKKALGFKEEEKKEPVPSKEEESVLPVLKSAQDPTDKGMKAGIASQLKKAIGSKEEEEKEPAQLEKSEKSQLKKEKKEPVSLEEEEYVSAEEEESKSEEEDGFVKVSLKASLFKEPI